MPASEASVDPRMRIAIDPRRAIPVLLVLLILSLVIDQGFKFMTNPMADDLGIDLNTANLQVTVTGIVLAVGVVLYAALADAVSMRRLLYVAISLITIGSVLGFAFQAIWPLVLTGRLIQTAGIAAAETLYLVYVVKYFSGIDQKRFLGYSTAAFQFAALLAVLGGGVLAASVHWALMFVLPIIMLVTLPFLKRVPEASGAEKAPLDVLGLFLIAVLAAGMILFVQAFHWWWLIPSAAAIGVLVWHIRVKRTALLRASFLRDGRYVWALIVVFIMYTVYMGYVFFAFPVAIQQLHGVNPLYIAVLMIPGYLTAIIVGVLSGRIAAHLSSRQAIVLGIGLSIAAIALTALFLESALWLLILCLVVYIASDSLLYAPLISSAVQNLPTTRRGVAIGFYNLVITIAFPIGAAYAAVLLDIHPTFLGAVTVGGSPVGAGFVTVLWLLAAVTAIALVVYLVSSRVMDARGVPSRDTLKT